MQAKRRSWRVNWYGEGAPEKGDVAVNIKTMTWHKVVSLRVIMHRAPLPEGATCRYLVMIVPHEQMLLAETNWTYDPDDRQRKAN